MLVIECWFIIAYICSDAAGAAAAAGAVRHGHVTTRATLGHSDGTGDASVRSALVAAGSASAGTTAGWHQEHGGESRTRPHQRARALQVSSKPFRNIHLNLAIKM